MTAQQKMDKWLDTLLTTDLPQTTSKIGDTEMGMCCLGVLDYKVFDSFTLKATGPYEGIPQEWELKELGLTTRITEVEEKHLDAMMLALDIDVDMHSEATRSMVLASMNDRLGFSFKQIANAVKFFGWDVIDNG